MSWTEPRRIPICRDVAGRPVDLIDLGDGQPVVEIGHVATISLDVLEKGLAGLIKASAL